MKRIIMPGCFILAALGATGQAESARTDSFYILSPIEVRAVRAADNAPFTKTNISRKEIEKANLGQDIPFLLNQTPGVVVNSDAGNGIGYTGIRIRGTDATRINVTLNGIPYNDAESQGTFFVDLPDFLSSAGSIQVLRGVGTSSNGSGAFGAGINISSNEVNKTAYAELNNSLGSFGTWKNTFRVGTGLINGFSTDVRLSRISSEGFIDRATSRLTSFYISPAYSFKQSSFRLNVFSGKEKTYQAWYGISEPDLMAGRRRINYAGTERPGEPYNNETDNYTQTHYQFFYSQGAEKKISFNTAFFFTAGKGYYEQYKAGEDYADYNLNYPVNGPDTIFNSDLVRQLWLDNNYYGNIFSLQYKTSKTQATLGGAFTQYDGLHFGKVIWAEKGFTPNRNWYDNNGKKSDFTIYLKQQTVFSSYWNYFYDFQYRFVNYSIHGFRYNPGLDINSRFHFFNPKAGISYAKAGWKGYFSFAVASKEPNRDDFESGENQKPKRERLYDTELGIERVNTNTNWSATFYYMDYKDQLILTGKVNDVGAYTRINIPESYRAGIELQGAVKFTKWIHAAANLSLSKNKISGFTEFIDDYDNGGQKTNHFNSTTIAFSPSVVGGATISIFPFKNTELNLLSKYVSRQYLDNTVNYARSLDPFFTEDLRLIQHLKLKKIKGLTITAQVNNIFNAKYEPNGYTFSYFLGGRTVTENYFFPMAGRSVLVGISLML